MRSPLARPPRRLAGAALALFLLVAAGLLGGCTQVRTALAIQSDDTVAGEIVIGVAGGPAPVLNVPAPLVGQVSVTPYQDSGYVGSRLQFSGLRFDQVNSLTSVAPLANGRFRFELRRTGGLVVLGGQVDLSAVPVDRADVQLKVAFPGDLVSTDGISTAGTVSWVFTPGQVSQFNAVLSSPDPSTPSVGRWTLLVAAVVAAAAVAVVLLARAHRNPPVPGSGRGP
ncbi:MAG TPA: DUF3153 domain-containing protein [Pseudonocardia sp.]|nr:DUF3153 domain-containing protein [Pseudonocardia sp.]